MKFWAHRGCCTQYPENTLTAFAAACQYEIAGIELDIQLTKDGTIVVIHDEAVNRTTSGVGQVKDYTLAELKQLDIAAPKGKIERIPTMREVLTLMEPYCRAYGLLINIEMKNSIVRYEGMEQKILDLVAEFGLQPYIVYSSFNPDSVLLMKQLDSTVQTGILAGSLAVCCSEAPRVHCDALHCNIEQLDEPELRQKTSAPVRAWNVVEAFYPSTTPRRPYTFDVPALERAGITDIFVNQPENFVSRRTQDGMQRVPLLLYHSAALDYHNGRYGLGYADKMATLSISHAAAGSTLELLDTHYEYALATFNGTIPQEFIYTYRYDSDAAWVTYDGAYDESKATQQAHTFESDCFFRVCLRRVDCQPIPLEEAARADGILLFRTPIASDKPSSIFEPEIAETAATVASYGRDCLKLALLADSHYVTNGFWEDTVNNLRAVNEKVNLDGIIHLGDLTDGVLPAEETAAMTRHCLDEMKSLGPALLVVPGNHDSAYFHGNPKPLTEPQERQLLYEGILPEDTVRTAGRFWYYRDILEHKLRILVLFSHDFRADPRYGFSNEELDWVSETLATVPEGWKVLVLSHCPPLPELHYWSKDITNGPQLITLLDDYNSKPGRKVLAFIHGHNHCEQICRTHTFPIISIGCAKCEYFTDKKPDGAHTEPRKPGTPSQELWDIMLVDTAHDTLRFVRFGAGDDRLVNC